MQEEEEAAHAGIQAVDLKPGVHFTGNVNTAFEDNIHGSSGTNMPAWEEQQHIIAIIREVHKPIEKCLVDTHIYEDSAWVL